MIAYYVHHHGSGHAHRAVAIAAHATTSVVGLSSAPVPPGWRGRWIRLPGDSEGVVDPWAADVTAAGTLHWAPRQHAGLRSRMARIGDVLAGGKVRLVVTDVSVEVSLLARLYGVPVVVMAQPGQRLDRAHRLAYDLAERLLAPWPRQPEPGWPRSWCAKTVHVGAISRYDGRRTPEPTAGRRVVALWGSGGLDIGPDDLVAAAGATPRWTWDVVGPPEPVRAGVANLRWCGWLEAVWPMLCAADVVVTHAGQSALAEVAAARRPAVVVPQDRPHGEQRATADALVRAAIGVVVPTWPQRHEWPALLDEAARQGGNAWSRWSPGDGATRAAAVLDELATATG